MEMFNLSVIIPTRNRSLQLQCALKSMLKQELSQEEFEVVVVDNGSTDNTHEVITGFENKLKNIRYIFEERPGLHNARHRGLYEAKSEILVFCDDDIEAFPTWLSTIKKSFFTPSIMLVGGRVLPKFEETPPIWILKMWSKKNGENRILGNLSLIDMGEKPAEINPYYVFGCNFSIRKELLLECGGFHPDELPIELLRFKGDGESFVSKFIKDKGLYAHYHPDASVYHLISKERLTLEYFKRRVFYQGISNSYTDIRNSYYGNASVKSSTSFLSNQKKVLKKIINNLLIDKEILKIDREIAKSYNQGYLYHQKEVKKDLELFKWVIKENYLEKGH